jgi:hypothetical protein
MTKKITNHCERFQFSCHGNLFKQFFFHPQLKFTIAIKCFQRYAESLNRCVCNILENAFEMCSKIIFVLLFHLVSYSSARRLKGKLPTKYQDDVVSVKCFFLSNV